MITYYHNFMASKKNPFSGLFGNTSPIATASSSYIITGSYNTISGGFAPYTMGTSSLFADSDSITNETPNTYTRRIKIPWKMYRFTDIFCDKRKSLANGKIIGKGIHAWWLNNKNWTNGGLDLPELTGVTLTFLNIVVDSVPIESNGVLTEKIAILPIGTLQQKPQTKAVDLEDYDFVFRGTMKVAKNDPDSLFSVQLEGIDVVAGKYELKK